MSTEKIEPVASVCNDYNADGKSCRITEYLPHGTQLYTASQLQAAVAEKQAIIDRLMLEFRPDEMTQEQIEEWKKHQVPAAIRQLGDEQ